MGSTPPIPEPEFLPPDPVLAPAEPERRSPSAWSVAPATCVLVAVNCLVFLWMVLHRVSIFSPEAEQLLYFGGNRAANVLLGGEWGRILTAMFVHVGLIHLGTNMWCLWNLGMLAEPLAGSAGLVAAYVLAGAAGNLLSTFGNWCYYTIWHPQLGLEYTPVGAGASGAVFGLAGLLIVLLKSPRLPLPVEELRKLRKSVIYFAVINFAIGIGSWTPGFGVHIDNMAHLGGFCCGLLLAVPMVPRIGAEPRVFRMRRRAAVILVGALLALSAFFLAQLSG
jgi:rhomboid protease GluP